MRAHPSTIFLSLGVSAAIAIPLWSFVLYQPPDRLSQDFALEAQVHSLDNFFDEETNAYLSPELSHTTYRYHVTGVENGVLLIEHLFDVRTMEGDPIFAVKRDYGIDPHTGKHVPGYGDRDREGYLFAPSPARKEPFTYWHVNYDDPITMDFAGEQEMQGLMVYRYLSDFQTDQTANLHYLAGVPEEFGINLDVHLSLLIEPRSGTLVSYQDFATAYFYNISTGERLQPWNQFSNRFTHEELAERIANAKKEKAMVLARAFSAPIILSLLMFSSFALAYRLRKDRHVD